MQAGRPMYRHYGGFVSVTFITCHPIIQQCVTFFHNSCPEYRLNEVWCICLLFLSVLKIVSKTWKSSFLLIDLLAFRARVSLNFIRLLRVVIAPSVTSESTGCEFRPVTSPLICFNSCKKLNTIFKWQTKKNRLELSAWYRMALLFSIIIHV